MTEREAFIRAIIAEPDDDTPRLIYADYLDDHGEAAHAEYIRVSCELARIGPRRRKFDSGVSVGADVFRFVCADYDPPKIGERIDLRSFASELRNGRGKTAYGVVVYRTVVKDAWIEVYCRRDAQSGKWPKESVRELEARSDALLPSINYHVGIKEYSHKLHRGFVSSVDCPESWWLEHGREVACANPLERVTLTDREPWVYQQEFWRWAVVNNDECAPIAGCELSRRIFMFLDGGSKAVRFRRDYSTRQEALDDLSQACIKLARSEQQLSHEEETELDTLYAESKKRQQDGETWTEFTGDGR